ncbi:MAG: hypothetical protein AAFV43_00345 [Planctomycetota bacterium]
MLSRRCRIPRFAIRPFGALLVTAVLSPAAGAHADSPQAATASRTTPVWTGPSAESRRAGSLPAGARVTIFDTRDGYAAIRPPADASSLIPASATRLGVDGTLMVTTAVDCWASDATGAKTTKTVRLLPGEALRLIGRVERQGSVWWRIRPPSGEFRWIDQQDLNFGQAAAEPPAGQPALDEVADNVSEDATTNLDEPPAAESGPITNSGDSVAAIEAFTAEAGSNPIDVESPLELTLADSPIPLSPIPSEFLIDPAESLEPTSDEQPAAANASDSTARPSDGGGTLNARLAALEVALSMIVAKPPNAWRLGPLRAEADSVLAAANTPAQRNAALSVAARIDRFARIAQRTSALTRYRVAPEVQRTKTAPVRTPGGNPPIAEASSDADNAAQRLGYDAVGKLRPVVSKATDAPRFAIVDRDGELLTLISPATGVDLQPHLGKQIGVVGAKGFIPRYGKPHLTAERVRVLR